MLYSFSPKYDGDVGYTFRGLQHETGITALSVQVHQMHK